MSFQPPPLNLVDTSSTGPTWTPFDGGNIYFGASPLPSWVWIAGGAALLLILLKKKGAK